MTDARLNVIPLYQIGLIFPPTGSQANMLRYLMMKKKSMFIIPASIIMSDTFLLRDYHRKPLKRMLREIAISGSLLTIINAQAISCTILNNSQTLIPLNLFLQKT